MFCRSSQRRETAADKRRFLTPKLRTSGAAPDGRQVAIDAGTALLATYGGIFFCNFSLLPDKEKLVKNLFILGLTSNRLCRLRNIVKLSRKKIPFLKIFGTGFRDCFILKFYLLFKRSFPNHFSETFLPSPDFTTSSKAA